MLKILGVLVVLVAVCFVLVESFLRDYARDKRSLTYFRSTYLRQQGWNVKYGQYELRSFDGGKNWYAVKSDESGMKIIGNAEDVHPGLLAQNAGMDALVKHVTTHGPISFDQPGQIKLFTNAGFTIEAKK